MASIGRQSCDSKHWDNYSSNKNQAQQFSFGNASVKSKERRRDNQSQIERRDNQSQIERKSSRKKSRPHDESDHKSVINRLVRENRRLQTEHVREIYSK